METKIKVGVFFCRCNGNSANYAPLIPEIKKIGTVKVVKEGAGLCSTDNIKNLVREIKEQQLNRLVVVGCADAGAEKKIREVVKEAGLNRHLLSLVKALPGEDAGKLIQKVKMGVFRASNLDEVNFGDMDVTGKVLVIGGGIAGMETALKVADRGLKVILIEREPELGGILTKVNSFYRVNTEPAHLLKDNVYKVKGHCNIEIMTNTRLMDMDGKVGNFTVYLDKDGVRVIDKVGAIVVATGFQVIFCPVKYGLGISENVIGQLALERLLKEGRDFTDRSVSLVVGKNSENFILPFVVALKNAVLLREKYGSVVNFFYTNIKVAGDYFEALYTKARNLGVNFFKFEDKLEITARNGNIIINYEDPFLRGKISDACKVHSDFIVLPEEILPSDGTDELAKILRVNLGPLNFFGEDNVHLFPYFTSRDGIYLVGSCQTPALVPDIVVSAEAIAGEIARKLTPDVIKVELTQPYVDPIKCAVCLTCYRCCPHDAITIVHDESFQNLYKSAAQMDPLACKRCGICAAECPGKAIQLPGYTDQQILAQLEALEG